MRIATWNVNSLNARMEKVVWWLERAQPDVLLMQETKLADAAVPREPFTRLGYELAHHGEGRWNGVAIASRVGLAEIVTNFGSPLAVPAAADGGEAEPGGTGGEARDDQPLREARMVTAVCGGVRVVSIYAPNGRSVGSPFYEAKLAWFRAFSRWLRAKVRPEEPLVAGGDYNVAPTDDDVWSAAACHGGTHVSPPERAAFQDLCDWGLVDAYRRFHPEKGRYSWWDYRAGNFHKNLGMRIDHLLVTRAVAERLTWAEIDREARKGKPTPSDHAPVLIDVDQPGRPLDAGWTGATDRIAARRQS
jgi:exodeoxyribonuclease-3